MAFSGRKLAVVALILAPLSAGAVMNIGVIPTSYRFDTKVTEPGTFALLGTGLTGLVLIRRRGSSQG